MSKQISIGETGLMSKEAKVEAPNFADFAGFIGYNKEGQEIITFGKHKGKVIEDLFKTEPGYFSWIQNADFPNYTKKVLRDLKNRITNKIAGPITGDSLNMLKNKFNTK